MTWQTDLIGLKTPVVGNVNLDPFGYVDEEDLALLTEWKNAGKTKKDLTAEQWAQADLINDGKLNDEDVEILAAYLEDPRLNDLS